MKYKISQAIEENKERDNLEISNLISKGYHHGALDTSEGYRIVWKLSLNKFESE